MAQSFDNWQQTGPARETQSGLGPTPVFRDAKDRRLASFGASPDTQHPDGYLGTQGASTRRQDKLLDSVKRQNHRSYSRGVHKGERINPGDYVWPDEWNLQTNLLRQSTAVFVDPTDVNASMEFFGAVMVSRDEGVI